MVTVQAVISSGILSVHREKPRGFADALKVEYGRQRRIQNNFKKFDLSKGKNSETEKTKRKGHDGGGWESSPAARPLPSQRVEVE